MLALLPDLLTLVMLIILQAVLGFDNLLYISLESKRAPIASQAKVRKWGIGIAIALRIVLLFVLINLVQYFKDPFFSLFIEGVLTVKFNLHSIIEFFGGVFIMYTAIKEIWHMMHLEEESENKKTAQSVLKVTTMIVVMNVVFSFDSILSAMALSDVFWVMATAIIISGAMMLLLADHVADFLEKNRMYEVLGLFILLIVGIMLISEGAHFAHLSIFNYDITPISKATFYFVISVLVAIDLVQSRYQKRLLKAHKKK